VDNTLWYVFKVWLLGIFIVVITVTLRLSEHANDRVFDDLFRKIFEISFMHFPLTFVFVALVASPLLLVAFICVYIFDR
jgi:hypothetical protein